MIRKLTEWVARRRAAPAAQPVPVAMSAWSVGDLALCVEDFSGNVSLGLIPAHEVPKRDEVYRVTGVVHRSVETRPNETAQGLELHGLAHAFLAGGFRKIEPRADVGACDAAFLNEMRGIAKAGEPNA